VFIVSLIYQHSMIAIAIAIAIAISLEAHAQSINSLALLSISDESMAVVLK